MSTQDRFPTESAIGSLRQGFTVTPTDDVELSVRPLALYVSATCDLATKMNSVDDDVVVWPQLAPGIPHPISPAIVMSTGTTPGVLIVGG